MTQGERLRMRLFPAAVVEVVAIAVAFASAAGGHGNYVAAKILSRTHLHSLPSPM